MKQLIEYDEPLSVSTNKLWEDRVVQRCQPRWCPSQSAEISLWCKGKGKMIPLQDQCGPEGRGIALLFHDRSTRRGWVVSSTPRPHFTPGKDPVPPLYRRLGGPQGQSGRAENLVPTGIGSQTVQPVVSCYTELPGPHYCDVVSWNAVYDCCVVKIPNWTTH